MIRPVVLSPEQALRISIGDFTRFSDCAFVVVRFEGAFDAEFSLELRRKYLSEVLQIPAESVSWKKNENGKPYLENSQIHFNVSHSENYWAFAFSRTHSVGIDLEVWRDRARLSKIAGRVFLPEENETWKIISNERDQVAQMLTLWTRKEAFIKAKGSLLFRELSQFDARASTPLIELGTAVVMDQFVLSLALDRS